LWISVSVAEKKISYCENEPKLRCRKDSHCPPGTCIKGANCNKATKKKLKNLEEQQPNMCFYSYQCPGCYQCNRVCRERTSEPTSEPTASPTTAASCYSAPNCFLSRGQLSVAINNPGDYGPISKWDTSRITDMSILFEEKVAFNGDVSKWNVSSATIMSGMFASTTAFNMDLGQWDVSNVESMAGMFFQSSFNQNISRWNTVAVENMFKMFYGDKHFNQNLAKWNLAKVTSMGSMFECIPAFNSWTDDDIKDKWGWDLSGIGYGDLVGNGYHPGCPGYEN